MPRKKYLRQNTKKHMRLGKGRKKKQVWRRPKGRDNKLRERIHGKPSRPNLGVKKPKKEQNKIRGKNPILIKNITDLKKITKSDIAVLGHIGRKNKIKIAQEAKKMNIEFTNFDIFKFLKQPDKEEKWI